MELVKDDESIKVYKKYDDATKTKYRFEYNKDNNICMVWALIDEEHKVEVGIDFSETTAKELLDIFKNKGD